MQPTYYTSIINVLEQKIVADGDSKFVIRWCMPVVQDALNYIQDLQALQMVHCKGVESCTNIQLDFQASHAFS